MQSVKNNTIYGIRGDTLVFKIALTKDGKDYVLSDGDKLTFTVKKTTTDTDALISKDVTSGVITIDPSDTAKLDYGTYVYDVQLTTADGKVDTVVPPHQFILKDEVTF